MTTKSTPEERAKRAAYMREWNAKNRERVREQRNTRRAANREFFNQRAKEWREQRRSGASKEKEIEYKKQWGKENLHRLRVYKYEWAKKDKEHNPKKRRDYHLQKTFGITQEDWDALFESQGRKCAMCGNDKPSTRKGWSTDHCHTTGKVRGILCHHCNTLIGMAKESVEKLECGIKYLKTHG